MKRHSTFMGYSKQGASDSALFVDLNSTFKKKHSNHICFIDDPDPAKDPNPTPSPEPAPQPSGAVTLTQEQFEQLLNRANGKAKDEDENFFDKRDKKFQQQKDEDQKNKDTEQKIATATKFTIEFGNVIKSNSNLFPETARTAIDDAKKEHPDSVVKQANLAQAIAARDFFKLEANLKLLDSDDRAYVENHVLKPRNDDHVDGAAAWKLVDRAIYNYGISSRSNQQRATSASGKTGYQTLDNHLSSFFGKHVKDAKGV